VDYPHPLGVVKQGLGCGPPRKAFHAMLG
jgi:hypothetical protein